MTAQPPEKLPLNASESPKALGADIRFLGGLLGQIIREQEGDEGFALVEKVRLTAINRRNGDHEAANALTHLISDTNLNAKRMLIRAFGNYFQLINIAEDQQRIRTLRDREHTQSMLNETIHKAIHDLHTAGMSAEEMQTLLDKVRIRLVLTAHPSEAKRQEILIKLRDIADLMTAKERSNPLEREKRRMDDDIIRRIEQLWQTRPTRAIKATVADEVEFGLYFITEVIMDVVIRLYEELRYVLREYYPQADWSSLPPILRFASWIGGDRDGNPNVTADVTLHTLKTLHDAARAVYLADIAYIRDRLTQATEETGIPEIIRKRWPAHTRDTSRYPTEIYRQVMDAIYRKLEADDYSSEALLSDLQIVAQSLKIHRSSHSADGTMGELIRKVELFGLHLVVLDVREDARLHVEAISEMFKRYGITDDYAALPEEEKQKLLTREIAMPRPLFPLEPDFSEMTNRIIDTWRMIATAHKQYGTIVIDSVIGSMSKYPSDVLTMLLFANEVGVDKAVDIVPLFETVDDLINAPKQMKILFDNPVYAEHLQHRKTGTGQVRQQIMIGYSDSNKDGGYIAANWSLYQAQEALSQVCLDNDVSLELFHGRGGSIGRGGGPTNRAIQAQPPRSMHGGIKITEQGEVIAYRYSNRDIAWRHLSQVTHAAMIVVGTPPSNTMRNEWAAAMAYLADAGRGAYRNFVYETDGFLDYWNQATPINELASMPIGSRPAKRKKGGFESIRAIPWVFSWMQSRAIIPSWFGVGHAFESYCQENEGGLEMLRTMYTDWPFFKALINNVELDVTKADMEIAALYAELVEDDNIRHTIFGRLKHEHERTYSYIAQITQQDTLLEHTPVIKRSIEERNPYIDPLNFIQVNLLRELRQLTPDSPEYKATLDEVLATINGIAAGMKTTG